MYVPLPRAHRVADIARAHARRGVHLGLAPAAPHEVLDCVHFARRDGVRVRAERVAREQAEARARGRGLGPRHAQEAARGSSMRARTVVGGRQMPAVEREDVLLDARQSRRHAELG
jgi:hypothetical protein